MMLARGIDGASVELHAHHIVIRRRGFWSAVRGIGGEKSIPISSITSVLFKQAGFLSPGHIGFSVQGESKHRYPKRDPNIVFFNENQASAFSQLRDAIQAAINIPSLAALAADHVRNRAEQARNLDYASERDRAGTGQAVEDHSASGQGHILIDASSLRLPEPMADGDIDASLSYEPDWNALGRRLKSLFMFLLKMTAYSVALFVFVGATGLGRRLEGFDSVTLSGINFRLITMVLFIAFIVALISPLARLMPLSSGSRLAHWVRRAPRLSLATVIFAIPMILVTGGPSPYPQETAPDREIVIERTGQSEAQAADLTTSKLSAAAATTPARGWSGHYDGTFDNATGGMDIVRTADGRLSISIGIGNGSCAGGIDAVVSQPAGDTITIVKAPYEDRDDQESTCRISLRKKGNKITIKEEEVCMNHHGMSCGFDGSVRRASGR